MKYKLVCFIGKSASGKDSMARYLQTKYDFRLAVSSTTRPIRTNEVDGVDYHYMSVKDFFKQELVESREYHTILNGQPDIWYYGLTYNEIDVTEDNVVAVVDPHGLEQIIEHIGEENIVSIYVDAPYDYRLKRAMLRDPKFEQAEFERREIKDQEKFGSAIERMDYVVMNLDLQMTSKEIDRILQKEGLIHGKQRQVKC